MFIHLINLKFNKGLHSLIINNLLLTQALLSTLINTLLILTLTTHRLAMATKMLLLPSLLGEWWQLKVEEKRGTERIQIKCNTWCKSIKKTQTGQRRHALKFLKLQVWQNHKCTSGVGIRKTRSLKKVLIDNWCNNKMTLN